MRGRPFKIPAIARAAAYAAVAVAIAATALHFRHDSAGVAEPARLPSAESDPLARELTRCQALSTAARDDSACEAAWAENRRRFFTYGPVADHASPPTATASGSR
jgi:conjugative transfer region protein TrbK